MKNWALKRMQQEEVNQDFKRMQQEEVSQDFKRMQQEEVKQDFKRMQQEYWRILPKVMEVIEVVTYQGEICLVREC